MRVDSNQRAVVPAAVALSVIAMAIALTAPVAHAQPANPPATTATQASNAAGVLFDKGRQYAAAGKYAEACAAFEQSQKLDPQLGTLYNLATCHAQLGKLATAWAEFHDLAQRDTNKVRRGKAAAQEAALAPRLPKLLIRLEPEVAGATVTSNGVDVGGLLGVESPVDLGEYVVVANAPGYVESRTTARVTDEGKTVTVTIELKRPENANRTATGQVTGPVTVVEGERFPGGGPTFGEVMAEKEREQTAAMHRRTLGIAMVAGGGALTAGGVIFGVLANNKWNDAKAVCSGGVNCSDDASLAKAQSATNSARVRGDISTALVITGAAAAGVGAYLWLRPPSADRASARLVPQASASSAGLALEGSF